MSCEIVVAPHQYSLIGKNNKWFASEPPSHIGIAPDGFTPVPASGWN